MEAKLGKLSLKTAYKTREKEVRVWHGLPMPSGTIMPNILSMLCFCYLARDLAWFARAKGHDRVQEKLLGLFNFPFSISMMVFFRILIRFLAQDLASKNLIRENKVVRLALFCLIWEFKLVDFKFIQAIKTKFCLSLLSLYLMFVLIFLI